MIGIVIIASLFASTLAPYGYEEINPIDMLQGPSKAHLLGTDLIGHDVLSLIMWAGKDVLFHGLIVVGLATLIGLPAGLVAGFYGGKVDMAITRVGDLMFALPAMIILIAIGAMSGNNLAVAMCALGVMFSAGFMRQVRAAALAARGELYVDAAFVSGIGRMTIIFRHIMPNVSAPIIVAFTQSLAGVVALVLAVLPQFLAALGHGAQDQLLQAGKERENGHHRRQPGNRQCGRPATERAGQVRRGTG